MIKLAFFKPIIYQSIKIYIAPLQDAYSESILSTTTYLQHLNRVTLLN